MASPAISKDSSHGKGEQSAPDVAAFVSIVKKILKPLASLRLTVVLFAMAIFIVLAGTLAQTEKDIWQVIDEYFRIDFSGHGVLPSSFAWIDFQIFFPLSFYSNEPPMVPGGFYFPKGWLIGSVMAVNLLVAHSLRFKIQASGRRLWTGLGVIAAGALLTWLVIDSGSSSEGLQGEPLIEYSTLWAWIQAALGAVWLTAIYWLLKLQPSRKLERWILGFTVVLIGCLLFWIVRQGSDGQLGDSSMRILWQLAKGGLAGLVLLAGSMMVFKRRGGIVLIHTGIGLMMFGELWVGTTAVEGQMPIEEGKTTNYVRDIRELELAVIDPSDPVTDDVVAIPQSMLSVSNVIRDELLPFDIKIVKYYKNSKLRAVQPTDTNPATAGTGLRTFALQLKPGTGTDTDSEVDYPAAYITFFPKGKTKPLGTHLVSLVQAAQEKPETITVGKKTYDVYLRFKRTYKRYSMHLIDVRKDDYDGTSTPRNYSSKVQLVDVDRDVHRTIDIWMNNPLRYAGETFYQSGYDFDPVRRIEMTSLQVVTNTGWMIPYVACMLVATGLLAHFSFTLVRFLRHKSEDVIPAATVQKNLADRRSILAMWVFPLLIVGSVAYWLQKESRLPPAPAGQMNLYEFGRLPILYEGRVKPIDTLARTSLRIISDRQEFVDEQDHKQPAIRWLLDVIALPEEAIKHKVFRIRNLEVLDALDLKRRKGDWYSPEEFQGRYQKLAKEAERARSTEPEDQTLYQKKILDLERKIGKFDLLFQSFAPPKIRPLVREDWKIEMRLQRALARREPPLAVPPAGKDQEWQPYRVARTMDLMHRLLGQDSNPATALMSNILAAYADGDVETFNREVADYQMWLVDNQPENLNTPKTNFEAFFNHAYPFYNLMPLYMAAFLLAALAWLGWSGPLNRAASWLILFTFVVHTLALVGRIYISGRPPVTNLYSSAIFIGWGCVVLGMILEAIYRIGIGNIIASVSGFLALLIAFLLTTAVPSFKGDTFTVMQAVLDTQFWLATHVVCITLGYATTYVAGLLGVLYILGGMLSPRLTPKIGKELARMIYGTVCFALFFSFVGTVLGGLWADDSWGRFWGWDPKENGALIIVLWNVLILHARWGGLVKERGLAVLAVGGNIVTSWSWFGVNELGVGLHSYGFTEGVLLTLAIFVSTQLAIIALGMMPKTMWWSFRH